MTSHINVHFLDTLTLEQKNKYVNGSHHRASVDTSALNEERKKKKRIFLHPGICLHPGHCEVPVPKTGSKYQNHS